ncbi:MAG TPA: hypothetical protein DEB55_06345 [Microbacterium sp.]|nr:hypothetical protein [Microbacterium sp.]
MRGAAAVAALTEVLEVQREAAASIARRATPAAADPSTPVAPAAAPAPEPASAAEPVTPAVAPARPAASVPEPQTTGVAPVAETPAAASEADPGSEERRHRTQPVPVIDIAEVEVEELGVADRLGLGKGDQDEVGPTS